MREMKRLAILLVLVQIFSVLLFAQKTEKFDIFTYIAPKGWQKQVNESAVQLGVEDSNGGICLVTLFKSVPGSVESKANFDAAWETVVKAVIAVSGEPQMQPPASENGWTAESGLSSYESDGKKGVVMLITMSGAGKMVNILVLTNTDAFQRDLDGFLGSIDLPAVKTQPQPATDKTHTDSSARLIGKWNRSSAVSPPNAGGYGGYMKFRYEFKSNGEYIYTERIFLMISKTILIEKEIGTYAVSGNQLSINPKKSVIETYTKDNNVDALGSLLKSQPRELEKTTYTFTMQYFSGIQEWNLVFQADTPTNRDGAFSTNTTFPNAWYFDQKFTDNDLTSKTGK